MDSGNFKHLTSAEIDNILSVILQTRLDIILSALLRKVGRYYSLGPHTKGME